MKRFKFWQTMGWHRWVLLHDVDEFDNPEDWDNMFSHECSCGYWWFA